MAIFAAIRAWLAARWVLLTIIPGAGLLAGAGNVLASIVAFFSTKLGQVVLLILVGFALFVAGNIHGGRAAKANCAVQIKRMIADAKAAQEARDKAAQEAAAKDVAAAMAELKNLNEALERAVKQYEDELAKRPADAACRLTPDDVKRLRKL